MITSAPLISQQFNLFQYRFVFETNDPLAANRIGTLYGQYQQENGSDGDSPPPRYRLIRESGDAFLSQRADGTESRTNQLGLALDAVQYGITDQLGQAPHAHHMIHAAVVYSPAGDLLISGVSGAGKSTLTLALAARGLRAGGDDVAMIDGHENVVRPVPRCFHLDQSSLDLLAAEGFRPSASAVPHFPIPQDWWPTPMPAARIRHVLLLGPERAAEPQLTPMSHAEMTTALLMETSRGDFTDREGIQALGQMIGETRCYRVWSGPLPDTVEAVWQTTQYSHPSV